MRFKADIVEINNGPFKQVTLNRGRPMARSSETSLAGKPG
jgi:hypothetical protein